jgi:glucose-1-phosphate thymidylyltransferase
MDDVCLVIGGEHQVIRDRYERDCLPARVRVSYAVQDAPLGTAHALLAAADFIAGHDVLVVNGDNLYPSAAFAAVLAAGAPAMAAFSADVLAADGSIERARIAAFAIVEVDAAGTLRDIIEKPPVADLAHRDLRVSMNLWAFPPAILDACAAVPRSARGEYELPDAVRLAMRRPGFTVAAVPVDAPVIDLSSRGDVARVRARLAGIDVRL